MENPNVLCLLSIGEIPSDTYFLLIFSMSNIIVLFFEHSNSVHLSMTILFFVVVQFDQAIGLEPKWIMDSISIFPNSTGVILDYKDKGNFTDKSENRSLKSLLHPEFK